MSQLVMAPIGLAHGSRMFHAVLFRSFVRESPVESHLGPGVLGRGSKSWLRASSPAWRHEPSLQKSQIPKPRP